MARAGKIVVVGAGGMLGRALVEAVETREPGCLPLSRAELNLTRLDAIGPALEARRPSAVFNASAFNDVAGAERPERRDDALALNRDAPREMARACARMGVPLVHVSTDFVFDGRLRRPYREDDATAPLQVYGRSKLEGERAVAEACPGALIARTSTLFGSGRGTPHYVDAILRQARVRPRLEVVEPPVSCPTYAPDLAAALIDLLRAGAGGVVHVVNDGSCSRLDLARAAVEEAGLGHRVDVRSRPADEAPPDRPEYSVLDTTRLHALTGRRLRPWREALREYLKTV